MTKAIDSKVVVEQHDDVPSCGNHGPNGNRVSSTQMHPRAVRRAKPLLSMDQPTQVDSSFFHRTWLQAAGPNIVI